MSASDKRRRRQNNEYYKKVLLQILGLELTVYSHTPHTVKFYHKSNVMILWTGANKLQESKSGKWITNADEYIIENVIKEKGIPTMTEWNNHA